MKFKSCVNAILIFHGIFLIIFILLLALNRKYQLFSNQNVTVFEIQRDAYDYALKGDVTVGQEHDIKFLKYDGDSPGFARRLKELKAIIQQINERQHLINNNKFKGLEFDHTVLVVRVHPNTSYLALFLESIRRILWIRKSLLIFAHDSYDEEINKAIRTMQFARILQIFYPYSIQLHPSVYPGEDDRFCQKLNVCFDSKKRDPVLSQDKLFWWWVTNQVFDHVGILRNYKGYIYFLDTGQYLTKDFIVMAKMLEQNKNIFCSECRILSLGSSPPSVELYRPLSISLVISVWGWSNYSNSGFGFNRTTWNEIKRLEHQFCFFKDPSWENSLKHVASKMREQQLYMLYIEAPRFFPLTGCGAFRRGENCDLITVYRDIVTFIAQIRHWEGVQTYSVRFDSSKTTNEVEARGQWGDARDIDLCLFFSSKGRRMFY